LLAFAITVSPVLGAAQSGPQLVADRYSYLSCLPLALLCAGALLWAHDRWPSPAKLASIAWLLALAALGTMQARVWRTSESLWEQVLRVDPGSEFGAQKLAQAQLVRAATAGGDDERRSLIGAAGQHLERVRNEHDPLWLTTHAQFLPELAKLEPARRAELCSVAFRESERAVALQGVNATAELRMNLATACMEAGQSHRAVPILKSYVEEHPYVAFGWVNLGAALAASGNPREAIAPLQRGVELDASYAKGWQFLARACEQAGELAAARAAWTRVLELWPKSEQARARLDALDAQLGTRSR
jgi:tetratricopeptide (TPR) repeat protein